MHELDRIERLDGLLEEIETISRFLGAEFDNVLIPSNNKATLENLLSVNFRLIAQAREDSEALTRGAVKRKSQPSGRKTDNSSFNIRH